MNDNDVQNTQNIKNVKNIKNKANILESVDYRKYLIYKKIISSNKVHKSDYKTNIINEDCINEMSENEIIETYVEKYQEMVCSKELQSNKNRYILIDNNYNFVKKIDLYTLKKELKISNIDNFIMYDGRVDRYTLIEDDIIRVKKFASDNIYNYYIRTDGCVLVRNKRTQRRCRLKRHEDPKNNRLYIKFYGQKIYCDILIAKYFNNLIGSIEDIEKQYIIKYIDGNKKNINYLNLLIYPRKIDDILKENKKNKQSKQNLNCYKPQSKSSLAKMKSIEIIDPKTNKIINTYASVNDCLADLNITKKRFYKLVKQRVKLYDAYIIRYKKR